MSRKHTVVHNVFYFNIIILLFCIYLLWSLSSKILLRKRYSFLILIGIIRIILCLNSSSDKNVHLFMKDFVYLLLITWNTKIPIVISYNGLEHFIVKIIKFTYRLYSVNLEKTIIEGCNVTSVQSENCFDNIYIFLYYKDQVKHSFSHLHHYRTNCKRYYMQKHFKNKTCRTKLHCLEFVLNSRPPAPRNILFCL